MTATPIPAGVLTVDDELIKDVSPNCYAVRFPNGMPLLQVVERTRARLLAGPPRPDGVPDDAVPMTVWLGREGKPEWDDYGREASWCVIFLPDGTDYDSWDADDLRKAGVPVPPYQPAPDPEALLVEKITADWTHLDPADSAPPVAGERTGPLGLSEGDTRDAARWLLTSADTPVIPLIEACRAAVAEWDAEPQPAETLTDIVAWLRNRAASPDSTWSRLADRIEAASRPDSDTIPVNRDHFHNLGVVASIAHEFAAAVRRRLARLRRADRIFVG